jgi:uncharacterized protein
MQSVRAFLQRHAVATYFGLVLLISWGSFLVLVGPKLLRGGSEQAADAFLLFPIIVVGVCLVGIALTGIVDGRHGLRDLFSRIGRWQVGVRWYAVALLTPLVLMLAVLFTLRTLISPVFTPKIFPPASCLGCCGDCGMRRWLIIWGPLPHTACTGCHFFSPSSRL